MKKNFLGFFVVGIFFSLFGLNGCTNSVSGTSDITNQEKHDDDTTDKETITKSNTNIVSDLKAFCEDSKVTLTWTQNPGYIYSVDAVCDGISFSKKENCTNQAIFYGLANNKEYTFTITSNSSSEHDEIKAVPFIKEKKKSDYLILMYADGDNELSDLIYFDINEIEYGLNAIKNANGSAKNGYASVNAVALWDATSRKEENTLNLENGSCIYELGPDSVAPQSNKNTGEITDCNLGANTKNLTYTACNGTTSTSNWMFGTSWSSDFTANNLDDKSYGETNMGSKTTLVEFLKWANERYIANHVILTFSDHGGGPRSEKRALCWDDSSGEFEALYSAELPEAFKNAGYSSKNKIDIVLMDVCFGASIEDCYELQDYVDYFVASPNFVENEGIDYISFIKSFKTDKAPLDICKQLADDFKKFYEDYEWDYIIEEYEVSDPEILNWNANYGIPTITVVDCSKVQAVASAINEMANYIYSNKDKVYDSSQKYIDYLKIFVTAPLADSDISKHEVMSYPGGYYVWLYDIGYMMDKFKETAEGSTKWADLVHYCDNVQVALNNAIVTSWRDSTYERESIPISMYEYLGHTYYGLIISGETIEYESYSSDNYAHGSYPYWYKIDLHFGQDNAWNNLLEYWFNN